MRTSWPALNFDFGEDVARRLDHAARLPVVGAGADENLAQVIVVADLHDEGHAAFEVGEAVVGIGRRLCQHGCVRGDDSGLVRGNRRFVGAGVTGVRFGAGTHLFSFGLRRLGERDVLGHLRIIEREAVLGRHDAAQKLHDVDLNVALRGCRSFGLVAFARGLIDGVKFQRVERRDRGLVGVRNRRQAPDDADVGFGVDVLAPGEPLLEGILEEVADGHGAAGDLQPVALRHRPLESVARMQKRHAAR